MSDWNTAFSRIKNSEARKSPTLSWEAIEDELDKNIASKNRNKKVLLSIMAAASVIVVAVFLVFDLNNEIPDVANDELNQELEFTKPQLNTLSKENASAKPNNYLDLQQRTGEEKKQVPSNVNNQIVGDADNLTKPKNRVKNVPPVLKTIPLTVYESQSINKDRSPIGTRQKFKKTEKEAPQPAAMSEDIVIEEVVELSETNGYVGNISFKEEEEEALVKKESSLGEDIQKNNNGTLTVYKEKDVYTIAKLSNERFKLTSEHVDFPRRIKINTSEKKISLHGNKNSIYAQRLETLLLSNKEEFIKLVTQ